MVSRIRATWVRSFLGSGQKVAIFVRQLEIFDRRDNGCSEFQFVYKFPQKCHDAPDDIDID